MANFKDGQVHKDKYFNIRTKIVDFVTWNAHVQYESSNIYQ